MPFGGITYDEVSGDAGGDKKLTYHSHNATVHVDYTILEAGLVDRHAWSDALKFVRAHQQWAALKASRWLDRRRKKLVKKHGSLRKARAAAIEAMEYSGRRPGPDADFTL